METMCYNGFSRSNVVPGNFKKLEITNMALRPITSIKTDADKVNELLKVCDEKQVLAQIAKIEAMLEADKMKNLLMKTFPEALQINWRMVRGIARNRATSMKELEDLLK